MPSHDQAGPALAEAAPETDPLVAAAPLFGKKWHVVVLHRLSVHGPIRFNALARSIEGLSHKVLSNCLDDLGAQGLVGRTVVSDRPYRVEYSLTPFGESLQPVLDAMERWGSTQVDRASSPDRAVARVPR